MSQQFQGSRSPAQHPHNPFYNPQKEMTGGMMLNNGNNNAPFMSPSNPSKSYIARSNIMEGNKPNAGNSSVYIKPLPEGGKFPGPTSPNNYTKNNVANFNGANSNFSAKSGNSEMTKSTIQEGGGKTPQNFGFPKADKPNFMSNTPTRRAPRMSEPGNMDPLPPPRFDFKQEATSPTNGGLGKGFREQKDVQFFKTRQQNSASTADDEPSSSRKFQGSSSAPKGELWSKSSLGKKKKVGFNDFRKIKDLGAGKYGKVSLVQQKHTGFTCALKVVQKKLLREEEITEQFIRELKIQMYLSHPNIIKMYGFFDDEVNIYILLQVGTGGQLFHHLRQIQPLTEAKVAPIMKQVCEAVNEIHSQRIIHRDIKPENIVIHDNVIKLCDFGWSVYHDNRLRTTFCGTPLYVCPQILKGREYDQKIDIWSLGIMMYEMLVGENPFKINKEEELIKIVKDEISIPSYVFVSKEARDFLDKCLRKNPDDRVNIKELLNHDFILNNLEKEKKSLPV